MTLQQLALPLLLGAFLVVALALSVIVPLGEAPDEVSHWAYVQYLIEHHQLPPQEGAVSGESHQAPLYYLFGALATFWVPDQKLDVIANPDWEVGSDQVSNLLLHTRQEEFPYRNGALAWHLVRLISVVFGAITVWTTYQISQLVFPGNRALALTAAALVGFLPEFTFISAAINNDNLIIALSALVLYAFLRLPENATLRQLAVVGLLLGLALLTKIQAAFLLSALALSLILRSGWRAPGRYVPPIVVISAVAGIVTAPWVIYNTLVFGDPLGMARWLNTVPRLEPVALRDWATYGARMYWSFFGRVGGVTIIGMPAWMYQALTLVFGAGLTGAVLLLRDWRAGRLPPAARRGLTTFGIFGLLLGAAHLRSMMFMVGMDQARQVFSVLPMLCVVVAGGVDRLAQDRRLYSTAIITVGMFAIGVLNAFVIQSHYAPAPLSPGALARSNLSDSPMDFGDQIRVVDTTIDSVRAAPGDRLAVDVTWQALAAPRENYWLLLQMRGKDGAMANKDGVPSAGRTTTDWWQPGQIYRSRHTMVLPPDIPPGTYTLVLGLHPFGQWEWLPVRGKEMLDLGSVVVSETGTVPAK